MYISHVHVTSISICDDIFVHIDLKSTPLVLADRELHFDIRHDHVVRNWNESLFLVTNYRLHV